MSTELKDGGPETTRRRQGGFTLVELLIVVIILGIIAAIVVPQLSTSTSDAKMSALDSDLARLRSAVDLYYQQHGHYPGNAAASGATCPSGGTAGAGTIADAANRGTSFAEQLTMYTNAAGQACSTTDTTFRYGPYLKAATLGAAGLPKNPFTDSRAVSVVTSGNLVMASASTTGGWLYDATIGKLIADHQDYDDR
ncbi:MAG: prepilin-type N-terminal cleavage/methylation domain-containing protein [Ectothiorhodospiraceae bacterium]|nr:prepilin-type N-terminal cleavage/methylation domain-containing protein [Chromatiales bacterium]MCP5154964.1 prepilin-type N-terminal cleavage/methylation domain-containing protein [Ectothiorhodospiraceae bacterium]